MKEDNVSIQLMQKLILTIELVQLYIEFKLIYKFQTNIIIILIIFCNCVGCWKHTSHTDYTKHKRKKEKQRKNSKALIACGFDRSRGVCCVKLLCYLVV